MIGRLWKAIVAFVLWRAGGLKSRATPETARREQPDPSERRVGASAGAERLALFLFALATLGALGFVALFVLDPQTQLLGLALGGSLALLAAALVVASAFLVPQETKVEKRPLLADPEEVKRTVERLRGGVEGITRRRLIGAAAGTAGAGLIAAVAVPLAALGPGLEDQLNHTPWRAGRRLINEDGEPVLASDVNQGGFLTAFPEGADREDLGSPIVVVRVDPATLRLPSDRADWAPYGILAYSKICTHAACAISLYRSPLSPSTETRGPALVCPCHYSTFDVLDGGQVEFGPAGRPLPQLPLRIDATGVLRAAGPMSGPIGPSWWGDPK